MGVNIGVWLVGARGSVATTSYVGAAAIGQGLTSATGMVTASGPLAAVSLPPVREMVFGGHDVSDIPLVKRAEQLAEGGVFSPALLPGVRPSLEETEARLRRGIDPSQVEHPMAATERLITDLRSFRHREALDSVVVVNVASTEPPIAPDARHDSLEAFEQALHEGAQMAPPSSLYAYAAFASDCSFVDFTPSTGARLPALEEMAIARGVAHAGSDGKTGETLLKTALAPMFEQRNLRVRSWAGVNLLGGGDGASLAEPDRRASKLASKGSVLDSILGYPPDAPLHIDFVPDMGDWKTAWDHVSFEGFLSTRMRLQLTWEGCDSALAAPLVLDLARLVSAAQAAGHQGGVPELGFFFKDPWGSHEHRLAAQYEALCDWATGLSGGA